MISALFPEEPPAPETALLDARQAATGSHGIALRQPLAHRSWRFPSSRRYLWDRTPASAPLHLDAKEYVGSVLFSTKLFATSAWIHAKTNSLRQPFKLESAIQYDHKLQWVLEPVEINHKSPCFIERTQLPADIQPSSSQLQLAFSEQTHVLHGMFTASMDSKGSCPINQLLQMRLSIAEDPGQAITIGGVLLVPAVAMSITPLLPKRLCDVPLAVSLTSAITLNKLQSGYLTMDQARSLVPLLADDPQCYSVPLVGVWVRGVSDPTHPLVAAAATKFHLSSTLPDKALPQGTAFLLLLIAPDSPTSPQSFEVEIKYPRAGTCLLPHTFTHTIPYPIQPSAPSVTLTPTLNAALPCLPISIPPTPPAPSTHARPPLPSGPLQLPPRSLASAFKSADAAPPRKSPSSPCPTETNPQRDATPSPPRSSALPTPHQSVPPSSRPQLPHTATTISAGVASPTALPPTQPPAISPITTAAATPHAEAPPEPVLPQHNPSAPPHPNPPAPSGLQPSAPPAPDTPPAPQTSQPPPSASSPATSFLQEDDLDADVARVLTSSGWHMRPSSRLSSTPLSRPSTANSMAPSAPVYPCTRPTTAPNSNAIPTSISAWPLYPSTAAHITAIPSLPTAGPTRPPPSTTQPPPFPPYTLQTPLPSLPTIATPAPSASLPSFLYPPPPNPQTTFNAADPPLQSTLPNPLPAAPPPIPPLTAYTFQPPSLPPQPNAGPAPPGSHQQPPPPASEPRATSYTIQAPPRAAPLSAPPPGDNPTGGLAVGLPLRPVQVVQLQHEVLHLRQQVHLLQAQLAMMGVTPLYFSLPSHQLYATPQLVPLQPPSLAGPQPLYPLPTLHFHSSPPSETLSSTTTPQPTPSPPPQSAQSKSQTTPPDEATPNSNPSNQPLPGNRPTSSPASTTSGLPNSSPISTHSEPPAVTPPAPPPSTSPRPLEQPPSATGTPPTTSPEPTHPPNTPSPTISIAQELPPDTTTAPTTHPTSAATTTAIAANGITLPSQPTPIPPDSSPAPRPDHHGPDSALPSPAPHCQALADLPYGLPNTRASSWNSDNSNIPDHAPAASNGWRAEPQDAAPPSPEPSHPTVLPNGVHHRKVNGAAAAVDSDADSDLDEPHVGTAAAADGAGVGDRGASGAGGVGLSAEPSSVSSASGVGYDAAAAARATSEWGLELSSVVRTQWMPLSDSEDSDSEEDARLEEKYGLRPRRS